MPTPKELAAIAAMADRSKLTPVGSQDVVRTSIAVTNAGDGLSHALAVQPQEFQLGETVHVVLRCEVTKLGFTPDDAEHPHGDLVRTHTLKAGTATIVAPDLVEGMLAAEDERITKALEAAAGVMRLDDPENGLGASMGDHDDEHDPADDIDGAPSGRHLAAVPAVEMPTVERDAVLAALRKLTRPVITGYAEAAGLALPDGLTKAEAVVLCADTPAVVAQLVADGLVATE